MASSEGDNDNGETEMPFGFAEAQAGGVQGFRFLNFPKPSPLEAKRQEKREQLHIMRGCSRFLRLFLVGNVFHQITGLTVQGFTHFVNHTDRQFLNGTRTDGRYSRWSDTSDFGKLFLRHFIHSKQYFDTEFYHLSTLFQQVL